MHLSDRLGDRTNHFNLLRLSAALVVLLAHSYVLRGAAMWFDLIEHGYPLSFGGMAVNAFFVVSGFLVTGSLFQRHDIILYFWSRCLRIFPGLWTMLIVTVFGFGLALTILPAADYLGSPQTHEYFWRGATLFNGVRYYLPGVFENNAADGAFNRSLWTLPLELRMYAILALGWIVLAAAAKIRLAAFRILAPLAAGAGFLSIGVEFWRDGQFNLGAMNAAMFAAGATIFLHAGRIRLSRFNLPALGAVLLLGAVSKPALLYIYMPVFPLFVLLAAYSRAEVVRRIEPKGDYSYGVYIYAFPIQQTLIVLMPDISPALLTVLAVAITLPLAAASWWLVEKPALTRKSAFAAATRDALGSLKARFAA
jgi:peptidoglycan/LPS O-acetylase OafA/YrhL